MSVAEMQACLARLYVDGAFRRLFALEPETVLGEYRLSAEEAQALRELDSPALERFARSLKSKRRRRFVATYPLLFGLASPAVERYYDRYYQLYPARRGGSFVTELLEFGRFMEDCLATDDEAPPFASDLARYERLRFAARRATVGHRPEAGWGPRTVPAGTEGASWRPGPGRPPDRPEPPPVAPDDRPRLADGVAVATFRTSILAIVDALEAGLPPPETGEGPYTFVFRTAPGAADPDAFYVTVATYELLDWCDGERTLAELAAVVEPGTRRTPSEGEAAGGCRGSDGEVASVTGAVQTLVEHGILTTAPAGPRDPLPPDPGPWLPDGH
jgi:hypothetical protein